MPSRSFFLLNLRVFGPRLGGASVAKLSFAYYSVASARSYKTVAQAGASAASAAATSSTSSSSIVVRELFKPASAHEDLFLPSAIRYAPALPSFPSITPPDKNSSATARPTATIRTSTSPPSSRRSSPTTSRVRTSRTPTTRSTSSPIRSSRTRCSRRAKCST